MNEYERLWMQEEYAKLRAFITEIERSVYLLKMAGPKMSDFNFRLVVRDYMRNISELAILLGEAK